MPSFTHNAQTLFDIADANPRQAVSSLFGSDLAAILVMADAIQAGIDPDALGYCALLTGPADIFQANHIPSMYRPTDFSLRRAALKSKGFNQRQDMQEILPITCENYMFVSYPKSTQQVEILASNGGPLIDPRDKGPMLYLVDDVPAREFWKHRIALVVKDFASGREAVIDPGIKDGPCDIGEWKELQNCPEAVIAVSDAMGWMHLHESMADDVGARRVIGALTHRGQIDDPYGLGRYDIVKPLIDAIAPTPALPTSCDPMFSPARIEQTKEIYGTLLAPIRALERWREKMRVLPEPPLMPSIASLLYQSPPGLSL